MGDNLARAAVAAARRPALSQSAADERRDRLAEDRRVLRVRRRRSARGSTHSAPTRGVRAQLLRDARPDRPSRHRGPNARPSAFFARVRVVAADEREPTPRQRRVGRDRRARARTVPRNTSGDPPHRFQPSASATTSRTWCARPPTHTGYPCHASPARPRSAPGRGCPCLRTRARTLRSRRGFGVAGSEPGDHASPADALHRSSEAASIAGGRSVARARPACRSGCVVVSAATAPSSVKHSSARPTRRRLVPPEVVVDEHAVEAGRFRGAARPRSGSRDRRRTTAA